VSESSLKLRACADACQCQSAITHAPRYLVISAELADRHPKVQRPVVSPTTRNKRLYRRCTVTPGPTPRGRVGSTRWRGCRRRRNKTAAAAAPALIKAGCRDHWKIGGGGAPITDVIIAFCEATTLINASGTSPLSLSRGGQHWRWVWRPL